MNALQRAADNLAPELKLYKIEVIPEKHAIDCNGTVTLVERYTSYAKCRTILLKLIRAEAKKHFDETQEKLL